MIAVDKALRLSGSDQPSSQNVETLGDGWVAEEALAIALYCSLMHEVVFREGVISIGKSWRRF
jgi:hypothetical protein